MKTVEKKSRPREANNTTTVVPNESSVQWMSVLTGANPVSRKFFASLLVLGGVALGLLFGAFLKSRNTLQADIRFAGESNLVARGVQISLRNYMTTTSVLKTLLDEHPTSGPEQFSLYAEKLLEKVDVLAYQYVKRVLDEEREEFEEETSTYWKEVIDKEREEFEEETSTYWNERLGTNLSFPIRNQTSDGLVVADREYDYYPITYLVPYKGNEDVVNFNILSLTPTRRAGINESLDSGEPRAFGPITIVQEKVKNAKSFVVQYPLENKEDIVLCIVRVPSMVSDVLEALPEGISLHLYLNNVPIGAFLGRSVTPQPLVSQAEAKKDSIYTFEKEFNELGRTWTLIIIGDENYSPMNWVFVVLPGLLVTTFFCILALFYLDTLRRQDRKNRILSARATEQAKKEASAIAEAERRLNDFLAHEVRNPLSVAISANQFVQSTIEGTLWTHSGLHEAAEHDLKIVNNNLRFIHELLDTMLDLNKFSQGQVSLKVAPLSLRDDVLTPVKMMLENHSAHVKLIIDAGGEELRVHGDSLRLKQIVLNLAKNSLRFVIRGYIKIIARRLENNIYEIVFEDSGPGIPKEAQKNLFKKYLEGDQVLTQGTGVGLCLSKLLIEAMGGSIQLDDTYHSDIPELVGSRFQILIPFEPANRNAEVVEAITKDNPLPSSCGNIRRVLVLDDDANMRSMVHRKIKSVLPNVEVTEVSSGEAAVELIGVQVNYYDLIFIDQYMPAPNSPLSGDDVIRILRSRGCKSIILGMSGTDAEEKHKVAGADAFVRKPFPSDEDFLEIIEKQSETPPPLRFLIVDDDAVNRHILERTIKNIVPQCSFVHCSEGSEVIPAANKSQFDVVFLDEHLGHDCLGSTLGRELRKRSDRYVIISISGAIKNPDMNVFNKIWGRPLPPKAQMRKDLVDFFRGPDSKV